MPVTHVDVSTLCLKYSVVLTSVGRSRAGCCVWTALIVLSIHGHTHVYKPYSDTLMGPLAFTFTQPVYVCTYVCACVGLGQSLISAVQIVSNCLNVAVSLC